MCVCTVHVSRKLTELAFGTSSRAVLYDSHMYVSMYISLCLFTPEFFFFPPGGGAVAAAAIGGDPERLKSHEDLGRSGILFLCLGR